MTLTVERPGATQAAPHATQAAPGAVEPGLLHVEVDPDAPFVAGHLSAVEMGKAATILAYLRERGVLVTASQEEILLVISREIAPALVTRVAVNDIAYVHPTAGAGRVVKKRSREIVGRVRSYLASARRVLITPPWRFHEFLLQAIRPDVLCSPAPRRTHRFLVASR